LFQNAHDIDDTFLRNGFQGDPIRPAQPQPMYYVLRSISTALDGFRPAQFAATWSGDKQFDCYTFRRGNEELMLAAWIPGRTTDGVVEAKSDVTLPGVQAKRAWVTDVFNGTEQKLDITHNVGDTILKNVLVKDYPVFIRLEI